MLYKWGNNMALSFRRFSWLWFKERDKHKVPENSSIPSTEWDLALQAEPKTLTIPSTSSNTERKWTRNKGIDDKEYSFVSAPSGGAGYESDVGSDWSVGWLEPHAPEFTSDYEDDEAHNNSFAVLVPCYRHRSQGMEVNVQQVPVAEFLGAVGSLPSDDSSGAKYHTEMWWLPSHY